MKIATKAPIECPEPIVIVGPPRSSTTVTGRILSLSRQTLMLHEPFGRGASAPVALSTRFLHPFDGMAESNSEDLRRLFFGPLLLSDWLPSSWDPPSVYHRFKQQRVLRAAHLSKKRVILKDPGASFSLRRLQEVAGGYQVACVREPLMTCASAIRLGFTYSLSQWSGEEWDHVITPRAKELLEEYPAPRSLHQNNAIGWCAIYEYLLKVMTKESGVWFFHDEFCKEPVASCERLYEAVGLPFDEKIVEGVQSLTSGKHNDPLKISQLDTTRNVSRMESYWDRLLTPEMAKEIEEICEPTWSRVMVMRAKNESLSE